jgi:hypothetical protein
MINQTWWQRVQLRPQQPQARPVNAVVTVHQGVTRPVAGGYMVSSQAHLVYCLVSCKAAALSLLACDHLFINRLTRLEAT